VKRLLVLCVLSFFLVSCSSATTLVASTRTTTTKAVSTVITTTSVVATTTTLLGSLPTSNTITTEVTGTVVPTQASVLYIILNPQSPDALTNGATLQMAAVGQFSDGTIVDITNQATWSSSNTAIATVSKTGLVKGISTGGTNISASLEGTSSNPPITVYVK